MRRNGRVLAGIEAGGTKFVCAVGSGPEDFETIRIPTRDPQSTVAEVLNWVRFAKTPLAIGIGCFGPLDLSRGRITSTPKPGWKDYEFVKIVEDALGIPVAFQTDVNAALIGEARWGAARGVENCIYMTVGTGIGAGALTGGRLLQGSSHPEMGHIRIPHDFERDPFPGNCPFHGDCLEGLASGPAIEARWGRPGEELAPDHPAWELEAEYLALGLANFASILTPRLILLGGGVMEQTHLYEIVSRRLCGLIGDYIDHPEVRAPELGADAGVLGAIALADELLA